MDGFGGSKEVKLRPNPKTDLDQKLQLTATG